MITIKKINVDLKGLKPGNDKRDEKTENKG